MDGRSVFKLLLIVLLAMAGLAWQRWSGAQREARLQNLKVADSGLGVVHFYADW